MSLVRLCVVTVSLFRVCMCMCLRARERERRERSTKAADLKVLSVLASSGDGCLDNVGRELRMITRDSQNSEIPFYTFTRESLTEELVSTVGPFSPKQAHADQKGPMQDKFTKRHFRSGLHWLSNNLGDECKEFYAQIKHKIVQQVILREAKAGDQHLSSSSAESKLCLRMNVWSNADSCIVGAPSYSYLDRRTTEESTREEVPRFGGKLKTLVDEFLEAQKIEVGHKESLTNFGDTCQCYQLPNQIMVSPTSAACPVNLTWKLMEFSTRETGIHAESAETQESITDV